MNVINSFDNEYAFLSNFWKLRPFSVRLPNDDADYPTVENAFQAAKTQDFATRCQIRVMTPGQAKRAGRKVQMSMADQFSWEERKLQVMESLLRQKFTQDDHLRAKLIATQSAQLIEGNTWGDLFWGMCPTAQGTFVGQNNLGKLLMQIRLEAAK